MNNYLVLWEFSKKQNYIFSSNKLKDNVGASLIMRNLSEDYKNDKLKEENFIIKGGGKNLYVFETEEEGKNFIKVFSKDALINYPGIELFIVGQAFDFYKDNLKVEMMKIYDKLDSKKMRRDSAGIQASFGIERICSSTGMVSTSYDAKEKQYVSSEINNKRNYSKNQSSTFKELIPKGYELLTSLDDMVKEKEKAYLAIVHIDGNGMGKKIQRFVDNINKNDKENYKEFNLRFLKRVKEFSLKITKIYEDAFKHMCNVIESKKDELKRFTKIDQGFFPLRPLILAGDDITYICNGCIGIDSSRVFIEEVEKLSKDMNDKSIGILNACAGVAIVKKNYSFKKAYEMAEELCASAKNALLTIEVDTSAIDFHICTGEICESIHDIRKRDYISSRDKSSLTMKPLFLNSESGWKNYYNFLESLDNVKNAIENKNVGRSKIKELREVIKIGEEATERYIRLYQINEEKLFSYFEGQKGDYLFNNNDKDNTCMYLDAIEAMDYFKKLK